MPPLVSTITLITELAITAGVLTLFYRAYKYGVFSRILALVVLSYEIIFNISYMISRVLTHDKAEIAHHSPFHIGVAIFHGTFSLLMFVTLIIFLTFAWRGYARGENFFKNHKTLSIWFLVLWMIAVISGALFYYIAYFTSI